MASMIAAEVYFLVFSFVCAPPWRLCYYLTTPKSASSTNCSRILYGRANNRAMRSRRSRSLQNQKVLLFTLYFFDQRRPDGKSDVFPRENIALINSYMFNLLIGTFSGEVEEQFVHNVFSFVSLPLPFS